MAKKIITTEEQTVPEGTVPENPVTENTGDENIISGNAGNEDGETGSEETVITDTGKGNPVETAPQAGTADTEKDRPVQIVTDSYPSHVTATLKTFPTYESLYVDSHGGVYTVNTAPAIRGNAILYKNPYHQ